MLLFGLLLPGVGFLNTALAQDGPTFDTDLSFYTPGDEVHFTGTGYNPDGQYNVTIDGDEYGPYGATDESIDITIVFSAPTGTYEATIYNVTDPGQYEPLVTAHFGLWGVDMQADTATISGGGVFADLVFSIDITNESDESVEGYPNNEFAADENGEFSHEWNFADAPMGTYTITLNGTGTYDDVEEEFELTTTIDLTAAGRADLIQQEIDDKILEVQDAVSAGDITDIDGALIAKLTVISDKIQQAIDWLGTSRDKVARNMLNAARNKLKAFINQVRAQRGKHIISTEVADGLIDQAENLLDLIDGLIGSMDEGQAVQPLLSQSEGNGRGNNGKGHGKGNNGNGHGKGKGKGKPQ